MSVAISALSDFVPVLVPDADRSAADLSLQPGSRPLGTKCWRRTVSSIDPRCDSGWAFHGLNLRPGTRTKLQLCALVVALDESWTHGPDGLAIARRAVLYEVRREHLEILCESGRSGWVGDLLGFIQQRRPGIPVADHQALLAAEPA